jgi:hypothetical protein
LKAAAFICRSIAEPELVRAKRGNGMRVIRLVIATALTVVSTSAAQAATIVVFVEPLTLERYTRVFDTPGPDRVLMCMAPPSTSGCTEVRVRRG